MNNRLTVRAALRCWPALAFVMLIAQPGIAHAYVGPAATMNFFGAAFGLIAAILSALGVLLFWPIKMFLRFVRRIAAPAQTQSVEGESAS